MTKITQWGNILAETWKNKHPLPSYKIEKYTNNSF